MNITVNVLCSRSHHCGSRLTLLKSIASFVHGASQMYSATICYLLCVRHDLTRLIYLHGCLLVLPHKTQLRRVSSHDHWRGMNLSAAVYFLPLHSCVMDNDLSVHQATCFFGIILQYPFIESRCMFGQYLLNTCSINISVVSPF